MENIFSSEFSSLYSADNHQLIRIFWKDKVMGNEAFKSQIETFSKIASTFHPRALIVDARLHNYYVSPDIQKWHDETIVPIYIKSGVKKMAFIKPESLKTELTTKKMFNLSKAKEALATAFFKSEEDALYWLEVECVGE
jgi:hypothetical protein